MTNDTLVITIDVECDADGGPTWRNSSPVTFRSVHEGLGEVLVPMLHATGAVASLLVSNVVLHDEESVKVLKDLPRVELGAHLHGEFLEPECRFPDPSGVDPNDNQNEYGDELERAKLERLGRLFQEKFGKAPTSFRAGRWSAGGRTAKLLGELGYLVDSSVTPHVHWTDGGRSIDYRRAPEQPYRPSHEDISIPGNLGLWELPVSVVPCWWLAGRPCWLRPSLSPLGLMKWVVQTLRRRHPSPRTFVLMLHNNELTPGASPYSRTEEAACRVAQRLEHFLKWATDQGISFATLTEAASLLHQK